MVVADESVVPSSVVVDESVTLFSVVSVEPDAALVSGEAEVVSAPLLWYFWIVSLSRGQDEPAITASISQVSLGTSVKFSHPFDVMC